jgi:hypothetical protein
MEVVPFLDFLFLVVKIEPRADIADQMRSRLNKTERYVPTYLFEAPIGPLIDQLSEYRDWARASLAVGTINDIHYSLEFDNPFRLDELIAWAEEKEIPVPTELAPPKALKHAAQSYSTPWLEILRETALQFFEPRRNPDTKREEVIEWIKQRAAKSGLPDSDNIASAIFTIVKPTDHDPKKRREKK